MKLWQRKSRSVTLWNDSKNWPINWKKIENKKMENCDCAKRIGMNTGHWSSKNGMKFGNGYNKLGWNMNDENPLPGTWYYVPGTWQPSKMGVNHGLTSTWFVLLSLVCTSRFVPLPVCDHSQGVYSPPNRRRSIVFRDLFQQTNKQTNKQRPTWEGNVDHNLERPCLEDTLALWRLPTRVGGHAVDGTWALSNPLCIHCDSEL